MYSPQIETESQINLPPKQYNEMTKIATRIEGSLKHHRTPQLLQGLYDLVCLGNPDLIKHVEPARRVLGDINNDELLEMDLMDQILAELGRRDKRRDGKSIMRLTNVAQLLNSKDVPEVGSYLDQLRVKYSPHPKKRGVGRRSFFAGVAAGVAVGFGTQQASRSITNEAASSISFNKEKILEPLQAEAPTLTPDPTSTEVPPSPTNTTVPATPIKKTPLKAVPAATFTPSQATAEPSPTLVLKPTATTQLKSLAINPDPTIDNSQPAGRMNMPAIEKPPTPNPEDQAKKEVADKNIVEFFLGDLIKIFKQVRLERLNNDPSYNERIDKELINSDNINILYLGIDNTRERGQEFNNQGWGRSDVIMLISFNPHTFKTMAISFPRDLFAPEMLEFIQFRSSGYRINAMTMTPFIVRGFDDISLARRIIENATSVPVDGVIKTNIDFMQGYDGKPGIFDAIFPNGLKIKIPETIVDQIYPTAGNGTKRLVFKAGEEIMNGRRLTEYGRSRHADSDFGRANRQRQILLSALTTMIPQFVESFAKGNSEILDKVIQALETQAQDHNLFSDINPIEIIKTLKNGLAKLRSSPQGLAALGILATNSVSLANKFIQNPGKVFTSFGLRSDAEGTIVDLSAADKYYQPNQSVLKVGGSRTDSPPTKLGNYLNYWKPIRAKVKALLTN